MLLRIFLPACGSKEGWENWVPSTGLFVCSQPFFFFSFLIRCVVSAVWEGNPLVRGEGEPAHCTVIWNEGWGYAVLPQFLSLASVSRERVAAQCEGFLEDLLAS